jgi:hypothetical protein
MGGGPKPETSNVDFVGGCRRCTTPGDTPKQIERRRTGIGPAPLARPRKAEQDLELGWVFLRKGNVGDADRDELRQRLILSRRRFFQFGREFLPHNVGHGVENAVPAGKVCVEPGRTVASCRRDLPERNVGVAAAPDE